MTDINTKVDIGVNEYVSKFSINRNIQKLLYNDQFLYKIYNKYLKSGPGVFIKGLSYPIGYKVWYRDADGNLGIYTNQIENNIKAPTDEESNWQNTSIASLPDGILTYEEYYKDLVDKAMDDHIVKYHEGNPEFVRADLSNIDNFSAYPYQTRYIEDDNGLVKGYVRRWRDSIQEYFLTYKFQEKTIADMDPNDIRRFFGGMLNSYGSDLKESSNPTVPADVNEYFETDVVRSVNIRFSKKYPFDGDDYCIFTSNALDANGYEGESGIQTDKHNYSPIDTVQVYNKSKDGFSIMRRFNGGSYNGNFVNVEDAEEYIRTVYKKLRPADKTYTLYIVGTW